MVSSSATKNSRLLNPWALAVVAVAVGGLLWATFQRESVFQPDGREPDAVSANYAELLLTAHPDDDRLRLQLVDLLIRLGDYAKAREHIEAWPTPQLETQAYYRLELDALVAASGNDLIAQQALVERLESFDHRKLPVAQLQNLAKLALTLQAPAFAASVFEEIAGRDPAQKTKPSNRPRSGTWRANNRHVRRRSICNSSATPSNLASSVSTRNWRSTVCSRPVVTSRLHRCLPTSCRCSRTRRPTSRG